jgi:DNA-binding response OmpR family regulator
MSAHNAPRGRVLIVDDQIEILAGMQALLEAEGMDVTTHDSMITLPLVIRDANPDLILLDLSFGALSGESFFRLGRERLLRKTDAMVVLFSGLPLAQLAAKADEFGADGVIPKSDDTMQIVARVKTLIQQHRYLRMARERTAFSDPTRTASAPPS